MDKSNNNNNVAESEVCDNNNVQSTTDDESYSLQTTQESTRRSSESKPSRGYFSKCFHICPRVSPSSAARLLLRNICVPKDMWDEFPDGLSYHITDYFLYQPEVPNDARLYVDSPARYSMQFEDVWIHTKDRVKIHGYLVKQNRLSNRNVPTVIFFHGNAGNIGHRLENVKLLYYNLNCNVLLVEYRGYGRSEGTPSEKGLYADAQAAFEYIDSREDLDSKKIIVFGRSLGGAVAIDLAARCDFRDRIAGLIVENTFTNIPSVAKELFQMAVLKWIPNFCYKNRYESLQKIASVSCPTMFISGSNDELLPPAMMKELFFKCSANIKSFQRLPGAHNDTWTCKEYIAKIAEFIDDMALPEANRKSQQPYSDNIV